MGAGHGCIGGDEERERLAAEARFYFDVGFFGVNRNQGSDDARFFGRQ